MKNVLITGASSGIGYQLARKLVEDGNRVLAVARSTKKLAQLKEEVQSENLHIITADISDAVSRERIIDYINEEFKVLDVLVNNAGYLVNKPFLDLSEKDILDTAQVNFIAPFMLIQSVFNNLKLSREGGHIVNISSMGGVQGSVKFPGLSAYSSSKGAISILTECLAEEFKEENVKINALALGAVQTEMLEEAFPGYQAPISAIEMAEYIKEFALSGHKYQNGKINPLSLTTP